MIGEAERKESGREQEWTGKEVMKMIGKEWTRVKKKTR